MLTIILIIYKNDDCIMQIRVIFDNNVQLSHPPIVENLKVISVFCERMSSCIFMGVAAKF